MNLAVKSPAGPTRPRTPALLPTPERDGAPDALRAQGAQHEAEEPLPPATSGYQKSQASSPSAAPKSPSLSWRTQIWPRKQLGGQVHTSEVFGCGEDDGQGFIYTALVEGDQLSERWAGLAEPQRLSVCEQLGAMVKAWRCLKPGSSQHHIGHVQPSQGPFHGQDAVQEFQDGCGIELDSSSIATVFTHADLHPLSIILSPEPEAKVSAIIDWARSGWNPDYWEFCKAHHVRRYSDSFGEDLQEE
ncbi:hypothetical protein PspLS_04038 [Pyricularia sp. CBS 133598]|nr:hypothetical protein PspLS_04038 [Pyricularia sp. CBS 133598]